MSEITLEMVNNLIYRINDYNPSYDEHGINCYPDELTEMLCFLRDRTFCSCNKLYDMKTCDCSILYMIEYEINNLKSNILELEEKLNYLNEIL